ncbi:hypothetical protein ACHQM5_006788 [Ranunculus cassubicifolius]
MVSLRLFSLVLWFYFTLLFLEVYGNSVAAASSFQQGRLLDGVPRVGVVSKHRLGGRKMAAELKKYELDVVNGDATTKTTSGGRSLLPVKFKEVQGFVPFTADYHVPKPHPPKNN